MTDCNEPSMSKGRAFTHGDKVRLIPGHPGPAANVHFDEGAELTVVSSTEFLRQYPGETMTVAMVSVFQPEALWVQGPGLRPEPHKDPAEWQHSDEAIQLLTPEEVTFA